MYSPIRMVAADTLLKYPKKPVPLSAIIEPLDAKVPILSQVETHFFQSYCVTARYVAIGSDAFTLDPGSRVVFSALQLGSSAFLL